MEIKTTEGLVDYLWESDGSIDLKKWVSVESLNDFITQLAAHPHYNTDDAVQQFMLDIRRELEK